MLVRDPMDPMGGFSLPYDTARSDNGRQGWCIFLLNGERFRTPESSKSQGSKIYMFVQMVYLPYKHINHNLKVEKMWTVPPQTLTPGKK